MPRQAGQLRVSVGDKLPAETSDDKMPPWAGAFMIELGSKVDQLGMKMESDNGKLRDMLGKVLEVALSRHYERVGVNGPGAVLRSARDVLELVLPARLLAVAVQRAGFFMSMQKALMATLLEKDAGVLTAIVVLLKGEGMEQEAAEVQKLLDSGKCLRAGSKALVTVQRCLDAASRRSTASQGLKADVHRLHQYCGAKGIKARQELLETELFVRCTAAVLLGSYTGVMEVDAGTGAGCDVDKGVQALRLRVGETKFNPGEMEAAQQQLQAVFTIAAFTLDKVLVAVAAAGPTAPLELRQLPRSFVMEGICLYAGTATTQQLQRQKAATDRRLQAGANVLSVGGLQSAVLQTRFESARHGAT